MLFTEEQARERWCPMVRFHIGSNKLAYDNRPGGGSITAQSGFCIASKCMMWRRATAPHEECTTALGQTPPGEGWKQIERRGASDYGLRWRRESQDTRGYCGLAGKPEAAS